MSQPVIAELERALEELRAEMPGRFRALDDKTLLIDEVVGFCEERGGSLSGEARSRLEELCLQLYGLGLMRGGAKS